MGTFFAEALLVGSGSTYTWVAAALLRALSVVPTERRRVVTIEGGIDPVLRKLIQALQHGAATA